MPSFQKSLCQAGRSRSGAKQTGPPALGPHSARPAGPEQKANPVVPYLEAPQVSTRYVTRFPHFWPFEQATATMRPK